MAEKLTLRDYQKSILDRLDFVRSGGADEASGFLGVSFGGRNVLVNLQDITEALVLTEISPVPLVKPWFLGMANVRGVLYAVNDVTQLLEERPTEVSSDTRMVLISGAITTNTSFLVDRLLGLRNPKLFKKLKDGAGASLCFGPDTYKDEEGELWYTLDCVRLVNSKDFDIPYAG